MRILAEIGAYCLTMLWLGANVSMAWERRERRRERESDGKAAADERLVA